MRWWAGPMDRNTSFPKATTVGLALGVLAALPALLVAVMSAGAGHGEYVAARALFPASMLLTLIEGSIGPLAIAVGLLQFPLYGALMGWAIACEKIWLIAVVAFAHLAAVIFCFFGVLPDFS
jgi:hypothetical protein